MINYGDITKENIKNHNLNWPENFGHSYRVLIFEGSWTGKRNILHNLLKQ